MDAPYLNIDGISAGYDKRVVIDDITLGIAAGESFGLIGLNGAGKTTLIKTMIGLKDAIKGEVTIAAARAGIIEAKRHLAFLPERFDPPWFLNAYEFIDFTLSLYGARANKDTVRTMAEDLGLKAEYLGKRAKTYSKGMRQKLGLMATLLTPCPLLILDEPMSGLDPLARAQVKRLIVRARGEGRTIFLSSHILSDMAEICGRVAIVDRGKIVFTGTPEALLEQTAEKTLEAAFLKQAGYNLDAAA